MAILLPLHLQLRLAIPYLTSFNERAYIEIKTIEPSITVTEFSTKWLNKCSSYYRSNKTRNRNMTLHVLLCFLINLSERADALRMNNNNALLQQTADQYLFIIAIVTIVENYC